MQKFNQKSLKPILYSAGLGGMKQVPVDSSTIGKRTVASSNKIDVPKDETGGDNMFCRVLATHWIGMGDGFGEWLLSGGTIKLDSALSIGVMRDCNTISEKVNSNRSVPCLAQ